jgi:hypothetical protein
MPNNARNYREQIYKNRAHPHAQRPAHPPKAHEGDSLWIAQMSFIPFLFLEYMAEKRFEMLPSGIVFPVGYLIFWAFYYTYCSPGYLEGKLQGPKKWDTVGIPAVLFGVAIWVVKVLVVELTDTLIARGLLGLAKKPAPKRVNMNQKAHSQKQTHTHTTSHSHNAHAPSQGEPALPPDITAALGILGIPHCRDWATIHRRYRELAKLTHPDLNPDTTQTGRKFMIVDAAYRKLHGSRAKYFH